MAAICLQAGALGLAVAIEDANYVPKPPLVRKIESSTNAIIEFIPNEVQSEAIYGNKKLHLFPLLRAIHEKYNRTSAADHEALERKESRTILTQYDNIGN